MTDIADLTPEMLLNAYAQGYFPMAESVQDAEVSWYHPDPRAILPMEAPLHLTRSNRRLWRQHPYRITQNQAFPEVMQACRENREGCWISDGLMALYTQLYAAGFAQSLELWGAQKRLMGGIYGIRLGRLFCAESMFSRQSGAGKIALLELHQHLRGEGVMLFDVQFVNDHLLQFGVSEIPRAEYLQRLGEALPA